MWFFSIHSHNGVSSLINEYEWPMNAQKLSIHFNRNMRLLKLFYISIDAFKNDSIICILYLYWSNYIAYSYKDRISYKLASNIISEKYFLSIHEFQKWITTVRLRFSDTTYWILSFYVTTLCCFAVKHDKLHPIYEYSIAIFTIQWQEMCMSKQL